MENTIKLSVPLKNNSSPCEPVYLFIAIFFILLNITSLIILVLIFITSLDISLNLLLILSVLSLDISSKLLLDVL